MTSSLFRLTASSARICAACCALTSALWLPGSLWSQNTYPWPASGNVGIGTGTAAPANVLAVQKNQNAATVVSITNATYGNASAQLMTVNDTSNTFQSGMTSSGFSALGVLTANSGFIYADGSAGLEIVANNAAGPIKFAPGGLVEKVRIDPSGNVGIGTATTGQCGGSNTFPCLLTVNGAIGAKEIIVTTGITADYVFQPDYRLKPLTEVASFIQEHHHLPEIPSEAEVMVNGISVGDMQVKLLAKVEELTLHMIQADERNNRLDRQNRELRERLARLEARDVKTEAPAGKVAGEK